MASSFKSPILQAIDQNGNPVPGAKLFAFASGTTTPVAIYSNQSLTTPLPNPLIANARGYFASAGGIVQNIWWGGQALRLRLTGPDDSVIWEIDNYGADAVLDTAIDANISGRWAGGNARSLAQLKSRSVLLLTGGELIQLVDGPRTGQFEWLPGNQSALVTMDPLSAIAVAPSVDPTGASGVWLRIRYRRHTEAGWFKLDADGADWTNAIKAAIAYQKLQRVPGTIILLPWGKITISDPIINDAENVTLLGAGPGHLGATSSAVQDAETEITATHTNGPVFRLGALGAGLESVRIIQGGARASAAFDAALSDIIIAPPDAAGLVNVTDHTTVRRCFTKGSPGCGILLLTQSYYAKIVENEVIEAKGRGIETNNGDILSRSFPSRPGMVRITDNRVSRCGGEGIACGIPNGTLSQSVFRMTVQNNDVFWNCRDASTRYTNFNFFLFGEDCDIALNAWGGDTDQDNLENHGGMLIAGRAHRVGPQRYVRCNQPIQINNYTAGSLNTSGIHIKPLGQVINDTPPTRVIQTGSGVTDVHVEADDYGFIPNSTELMNATPGSTITRKGLVTKFPTTRTIDGGVLRTGESTVLVVGEGATTDDLDAIRPLVGDNFPAGTIITAYSTATYTITIRHNSSGGNIRTRNGRSIQLGANASVQFISTGSNLLEVGPGSEGRYAVSADTDVTLTANASANYFNVSSTLTANRTITLSTANAISGAAFHITRTGAGAFDLDVGGLATLAQNQWCVVVFDGTNWRLHQRGSLV